MHTSIMRTELFVGVFGTKCCVLNSNKYGTFFKFKYLARNKSKFNAFEQF